MKTSTLVGITIIVLLCCTLPAAASDYTLGIFGNANEDDTINMQDVTYTELIILEYRDKTELSDAKHDGKINMQDVTQIELVILGREKELTLVDSVERVVTVKKPVERVIVLGDSQADAMRVLGAEGKAVGRDSSPPEYILVPVISELPTVGDYLKPDAEAILALEPDIVLGYDSLEADLDEKIAPYVAVVRLNFRREIMMEDMKKLGYILDKSSEAEEFCDWHEGCINLIKDRTEELPDADKPRVFLENYPRYKKYYTGGKKCVEDYICEMAGGINIAADKPSGVVDPEWVIEQNPDFIMVGAMSTTPSGYGVDDMTGVKTLREEVMNRPELKNINAVEDENVYCTASDIVHGGQSFISIMYWAKWFHPELFEDLDPKEIHKEYLDRFQRIDYDIDEHGVFVYPPPEES